MGQAAKGTRPKHQRHLRNLLLDPRFQLKYAGFLAGITAVLSITLGLMLWSTSKSLIGQSRSAVTKGEQAVALGHRLTKESRKVSQVVQMNIVKDPMYGDNPELLEAFKADAKEKDDAVAAQQQELEDQARALTRQAADLENQQRTILYTLFSVLSLLVLAVGAAGIVITHKVAGPIFKMTRQIREVGEGSLAMPAPLRDGDELVDFFAAFATMVGSLRKHQKEEIAQLDEAIAELREDHEDAPVASLEKLRAEMEAALER
jgi:nitrogen fixation/metabolism regulation signal transduction histidine kinase